MTFLIFKFSWDWWYVPCTSTLVVPVKSPCHSEKIFTGFESENSGIINPNYFCRYQWYGTILFLLAHRLKKVRSWYLLVPLVRYRTGTVQGRSPGKNFLIFTSISYGTVLLRYRNTVSILRNKNNFLGTSTGTVPHGTVIISLEYWYW